MIRVKRNGFPAALCGYRNLLRIFSFVLLLALLAGTALAESPDESPEPVEPVILQDYISFVPGSEPVPGWEQFEQPAGQERYAKYMFYWVYTPEDLEPGLPLVIYLHTSEGVKHGPMKDILPALMDSGVISDPHAVILVPQLPRSLELPWANVVVSLESIVDRVIFDYDVDTSRISLCGASLGGIGVWELASRSPGKYARILCVGGKVEAGILPESFVGSEIKVYSASGDKVGNPKSSEDFVAALQSAGVSATYELLTMKHLEAPVAVFSDREIQEWLWMNPRGTRNPPDTAPTEVPKVTFVPTPTPSPVPTPVPEITPSPEEALEPAP